jgi:cobalt-zinc-cadmium efflux system outer membrane protein
VAKTQLDFDVARAFALALAADKRVEYATQAVEAFLTAQEISRKRLSEGDVSGYANRRLGLETARYLGLRAEAMLERRKARLALGALLAPPGEAVLAIETPLADPFMMGRLDASLEDLRDLALQRRAELRALELETQASMANAELVSRSRIPTPIVSAGFKTERSAGDSGTFDGFVAGVSVPIPLWNRSGGAVAATKAEVRGLKAELHALRRRLVVEVEEAWAGLHTSAEQLDAIRPHLGSELEAAVTAARTAYAEGEISLVEWLDAVRAYNEAQSTFALLKADYLIQRATLERAVGSSIFGGP